MEGETIRASVSSEHPKEDSGAGHLGIVLALVYGVGLTTTNLFLRSWGFGDFSLLRPKAIFTGALVIGTLALIAAGPLHVITLVTDPRKTLARPFGIRFLIKQAAKVIVPFLLVSMVAGFLPQSKNSTLLSPTSTNFFLSNAMKVGIQLYISSLLVLVFAIISLREIRNLRDRGSFYGIGSRLAKTIIPAACLILCLGWYVDVFALTFYIHIPPAIGGGSPEEAQFIIQQDFRDELSNKGIHFDDNDLSLTYHLCVIHESENSIDILVPKDHLSTSPEDSPLVAMQLDRKLVTGMIASAGGGRSNEPCATVMRHLSKATR